MRGLIDLHSQKVSVLTGWNRDLWARARMELQENPDAAASLRDIETAVAHLVLSDKRPNNPEEVQNLAQVRINVSMQRVL
jgi:hypothetical protein